MPTSVASVSSRWISERKPRSLVKGASRSHNMDMHSSLNCWIVHLACDVIDHDAHEIVHQLPAHPHRINGILVETHHYVELGQSDGFHVELCDDLGEVLLVFGAVHTLRGVNDPHGHVCIPFSDVTIGEQAPPGWQRRPL